MHVVPVKDLYRTKGAPMHMFLTHLVEKYPEYAEFAKKEQGYKILDNSLIELGDAVSMHRVFQAAQSIDAHEVVLPDVFLNKMGTLTRTLNSLDELMALEKEHGVRFNKMAVVHGKDEKEWFECFKILNSFHDVDVLGIPKVTHKLHPKGRPYFVNNILKHTTKEIHLLGIWNDFHELDFIRYPGRVRSVDSSLIPLYIKNGRDDYYIRPDEEVIDLENDVLPNDLMGISTDVILQRVSEYVASL